MRAWNKGNVTLANAPGAGVADDKVVYTYVPAMIKYYLDEDPILPNVHSYMCSDKLQMKHVLQNMEYLVVNLPMNPADMVCTLAQQRPGVGRQRCTDGSSQTLEIPSLSLLLISLQCQLCRVTRSNFGM
jgi:hypothetical protein